MVMKKTLLNLVQDILEVMDSEEVNSISDTTEAGQIATIVETVFYNMIATRKVPEHKELIKITSHSDSSRPTHFTYPTNVKTLNWITYDKSDDGTFLYSEVDWVEPEVFLDRTDGTSDNYDSVEDVNAGVKLRIRNDKQPDFYTSFDDENIVMDSYQSSVDTTLQTSKTRAYGVKYPVFSKTDDYVPDLDADFFPLLLAEATSMSQSLLKGGSDPKTEQAARRQKSYHQNDLFRTKRGNTRVDYGRN
jgi:hypothetical protein